MTHSKDIEEFRRLYTDKDEIKPIVTANDLEQFFTTKLSEAEKRGAEAERERVESKLGFMRQWLNENRITDPKKMVTTGELKVWTTPTNVHT